MKIAVIGGGIGGLAAGVALQRRGLEAHVYEAAPALRPVGKGIWVPSNAMLVLDRLGLGDAVAAQGVALERIEVRDLVGRTVRVSRPAVFFRDNGPMPEAVALRITRPPIHAQRSDRELAQLDPGSPR